MPAKRIEATGPSALQIAPRCLACDTSLRVLAQGKPSATDQAVVMKCQHAKCRREYVLRVTMQPVTEPRIEP